MGKKTMPPRNSSGFGGLDMNMSWLIILFHLNGTLVIVDDFQPVLVPTSKCRTLQQTTGQLLALAFPDTSGLAFCIPDPRNVEAPDVPA